MNFYAKEDSPVIKGQRFEKLIGRIEKKGCTPFEFLHFVIHYYGTFGTNFERLRRVNLLTCDQCWKLFTTWKSTQLQEILCDARLQYEEAERHVSIGLDRTEILMKGFLSASSIARVELALYWDSKEKQVDRAAVIKRFGCAAAELAIGAPEWLHAAPTFRRYAQERYKQENQETEEEWKLLYSTMQAKKLIDTE